MLNLSLRVLVLASLMLCAINVSAQESPVNPAAKLLPNKIGEFRAAGPIETSQMESLEEGVSAGGVSSSARRSYSSKDNQRFSVTLVITPKDSSAYSMLTESRRRLETSKQSGETSDAAIGTAGFSIGADPNDQVNFFKGRVFASVRREGKSSGAESLFTFANSVAESLDRGEGEIPVLVKHLPEWEKAKRTALYVVDVETLKKQFGEQSVFDVVSFSGGAEAVQADYGDATLVLIEFNTPQLATENDQRVVATIQELRNNGMAVPTAYRRVGNYAVFVFNAPSEQAANQLIDQVKYQQVVQWLGTDPNLYERYERAQREFVETTLGVFVAVVKGSGLALVICFAVGGLSGALLFMRRRAQQRASEAYSDAGGMLRLNLDDITPQTDPARLVGPRN